MQGFFRGYKVSYSRTRLIKHLDSTVMFVYTLADPGLDVRGAHPFPSVLSLFPLPSPFLPFPSSPFLLPCPFSPFPLPTLPPLFLSSPIP